MTWAGNRSITQNVTLAALGSSASRCCCSGFESLGATLGGIGLALGLDAL